MGVRPIFVVGASRSGTTLLARMLGRHPNIQFARETQFFDDIWPVRRLRDPVPPRAGRDAVRRTLRRAAGDDLSEEVLAVAVQETVGTGTPLSAAELYIATMSWLAARAGKSAFVEHTPRNVYYLPELAASYPDARFICIVRDARAVVASQKMRWRQRSLGAHKISRLETLRLRVNYHPYTSCRLWNQAMQCINSHQHEQRVSRVRYEDLVEHPRATASRLLEDVGFEYMPEVLDVPLWGSSHEVHAVGPRIDASLSSRWQQVLSPTEQSIVESRCEPLMREFGYELQGKPGAAKRLRPSLLYPLHCLAVMAMNPRRALVQRRSLT